MWQQQQQQQCRYGSTSLMGSSSCDRQNSSAEDMLGLSSHYFHMFSGTASSSSSSSRSSSSSSKWQQTLVLNTLPRARHQDAAMQSLRSSRGSSSSGSSSGTVHQTMAGIRPAAQDMGNATAAAAAAAVVAGSAVDSNTNTNAANEQPALSQGQLQQPSNVKGSSSDSSGSSDSSRKPAGSDESDWLTAVLSLPTSRLTNHSNTVLTNSLKRMTSRRPLVGTSGSSTAAAAAAAAAAVQEEDGGMQGLLDSIRARFGSLHLQQFVEVALQLGQLGYQPGVEWLEAFERWGQDFVVDCLLWLSAFLLAASILCV
jgi:hypothetical protein